VENPHRRPVSEPDDVRAPTPRHASRIDDERPVANHLREVDRGMIGEHDLRVFAM